MLADNPTNMLMMPKYAFFVGADMSKVFFDVSYHDGKACHYLGQYSNCIKGFKQMVKLLKKKTHLPCEQWFVCFENTGVYSKAFLEWLCSQQIICKEENALKIARSLGLRRGKDDKTDSKAICLYAYEKRGSLEPSKLPKPLIAKMKVLLSRRDFYVRHRTSMKNSLKEQKHVMAPHLYEQLKEQNDQHISLYDKSIKAVEKEIENLMESDQKVKKNYDLVQSVIGIGPITGAYIIAWTDNFTCFKNARKFASYSGIAPFPNSSGTKVGKNKVSHLANKKIKSLLSNGVQAAIQYDKEIQLYYYRKIAEGKHKGSVMNAIKNKLVQRVFAVINRQTKYVKLSNYA